MTKHKNKSDTKLDESRSIRLVILGLFTLSLLIIELLYGTDVKVLNPGGLIAGEQLKLIVFSAAVLLVIGIPSVFLFYYYAWKFRENNTRAAYQPDAKHGKSFVFAVWAIPSLFALLLAPVMWTATHRLEPNDAIDSNVKPLTVQVVALRWKWLFIYPEQQIATVNYVQVPAGTPVQFDLTADEAPMSSFWIPNLGGQLYAMTGHINRLNLIAESPGDYRGGSAELNGAGYAGMKFNTRASTQEAFDQWVDDVQQSKDKLDAAGYQRLLEPSQNHPAEVYSLADQELYGKVLMKYMGSHGHAEDGSGSEGNHPEEVHQHINQHMVHE